MPRRAECTRCPQEFAVDADGHWFPLSRDGTMDSVPADQCPSCGNWTGEDQLPSLDPVEPPEWATNPPDLMDPAELERHIDMGARLLEKAAPRLGQAIKRWGDVEARWQVEFRKATLDARDDPRARAKDLREALAFESMGSRLYTARLLWQAEVQALESYVATMTSVISARQTLLNNSKKA